MPASVKICGVTRPEDVQAAQRAGADYVGFVIGAESPRRLGPETARALAMIAGDVRKVGLFVDSGDELIAAAASYLDIIQLHGAETPARAAEIRAMTECPVWKAVGISSRADLAAANAYAGAADRLLLDAKPPAGSARTGGHGVRFDWRLLSGQRPAMRWGLAGGLTPDNVAEAIRTTGAPLVDTSSGVETAPGIKSAERIDAFMEAVRSA